MADGSGRPFVPEPEPLRLNHAYNSMLGKWIAIVRDPSVPAEQSVLAVAFLSREEECHPWFERMLVERPWDRRRPSRT